MAELLPYSFRDPESVLSWGVLSLCSYTDTFPLCPNGIPVGFSGFFPPPKKTVDGFNCPYVCACCPVI